MRFQHFDLCFRLCPDDRHRECTKQESEDPKVGHNHIRGSTLEKCMGNRKIICKCMGPM